VVMRGKTGRRKLGADKPFGSALSSGQASPAGSSANLAPTSKGLIAPSMRAASQTVSPSAEGSPRRASHSAAQPASSAKTRATCGCLDQAAQFRQRHSDVSVMCPTRLGMECPETGRS
jgi:hypothetical protein